VGAEHLSPRVVERIGRFELDNATVKVDWALDAPIPWDAEDARRAGTLHVGDSMDHLTMFNAQLAMGVIPDKPFLLFGQMTTTDPTRSPAGTEAAWAYTHVPREVRGDAGGGLSGAWDDKEAEEFADRMEAAVEARAPGFRDRIIGRHIFTPVTMEATNRSLVDGAVNAGTAQLHQQLVFRPLPGLGRAETPIAGLYLAGASAHPGGGVHGACGGNAARAALLHDRARRLLPIAGGAGMAALALRRARRR
jgi:phytoene dehydrogenase-like protein